MQNFQSNDGVDSFVPTKDRCTNGYHHIPLPNLGRCTQFEWRQHSICAQCRIVCSLILFYSRQSCDVWMWCEHISHCIGRYFLWDIFKYSKSDPAPHPYIDCGCTHSDPLQWRSGFTTVRTLRSRSPRGGGLLENNSLLSSCRPVCWDVHNFMFVHMLRIVNMAAARQWNCYGLDCEWDGCQSVHSSSVFLDTRSTPFANHVTDNIAAQTLEPHVSCIQSHVPW